MTPFEFDILLHYYSSCEDHRAVMCNPPIWTDTRDAFLNQELIELVPPSEHTTNYTCTYRLTKRGKAYIDFALATPLPVQKWVMPKDLNWIERAGEGHE